MSNRTEELLARGVELRRRGQEQDALRTFEEAFELSRSPRARAQMGLAARALRLYLKAEQYLTEALSAEGDPWIRQHRAVLEDALAFAAGSLAWLMIETNAGRAVLVINGEERVVLPLSGPRRVVAGAVRLEVQAAGYRPHSATHVVPARRTTTLALELERSAPPPAPGRDEAPGAFSRARTATAAPRAPATPAAGRGGARQTAIYALAATSGAGFAFGGYFGLRARSLKIDRDRVCPDVECPTLQGVQLDDEARETANYSTLGFATGAMTLAAAAYLYFSSPSSHSSRASSSSLRFHVQRAPAAGGTVVLSWKQ